MQKVSEIKGLNEISQKAVSYILEEMRKDGQVDMHLPGGGYLQINEALPYLLVYRVEDPVDNATVRMVLSESSYLIIGNKDFEGYSNLIYALGEQLSTRFKSFLVFEIMRGNEHSREFVLKGPADRLPSTMDVLKKELEGLNKKYEFLEVSAVIQNTEERQKKGDQPLLSIQQAKQSGCLLLGLEIPPVYQDDAGMEYPVFFRSFKNDLVNAIHQGIYDYIRVQTSSGATSYLALGKKKLKKKVFKIDKELAEIEKSYNFLWLVSPSNIRQIKESFFSSNYEKIENYHYRLLPIDPDLLKRRLYNLKIEEIDDPAMSFIFNEKREELDQQISMLNERGTKNFFYNSIRLYGGVESHLKDEALAIVKNLHHEEVKSSDAPLLNAEDFKGLAEKEMAFFKKQNPAFDCKINIREDVNILMVSRGELLIPSDATFNSTEAEALIQHEVGTHVLTYFNGTRQPLEQLSIGFADYDNLQEGLAVMAEYLVGGLTINRIRLLAGRVLAGHARMNGADFKEIFTELHEKHGFPSHPAFNITSRIMQGGGFLKDVIYLRGLAELKEYLINGGEMETLLLGKFALKHVRVIEELLDRQVLKKPNILPSYMNSENAKNRLEKIRKGLPLSQMIGK